MIYYHFVNSKGFLEITLSDKAFHIHLQFSNNKETKSNHLHPGDTQD